MKVLSIIIIISQFIGPGEKSLLEKLAEESKDLAPISAAIDLYYKNNMDQDLPIIIPIDTKKYRISSHYGYRTDPITRQKRYHSGIDFACQLATLVKATANGKVKFIGLKGGYGKAIILQHKYGYSTIYGHLSEYYVTAGEIVPQGKVIGFVGSTGRSTGNHLHYEVRKNDVAINPLLIK